MLTKFFKYSSIVIFSSIFLVSCEKEENESVNLSEALAKKVTQVSNPLHFTNKEDLVATFNNYYEKSEIASRASSDDFVSYLETVMSEDGYEDLPYAILSDAFGSILNSEGELCFGDNLLHVSDKGILYGPISDSADIRSLATNPHLLDLCTEHGYYAPVADSSFYKINGYDNIYLYDTFLFLNKEEFPQETRSDNAMPLPTIYNTKLNTIKENSVTLGFRKLLFQDPDKDSYNWNREFTRPTAGNQKVKFSDGRHCNDTKIYRQNYGFMTDSGLKSKTMKKRKLGYWDKIDGDMEAGIKGLSLYEKITLNDKNFRYPVGVSTVNFGGSSKVVYNIPTNDSIEHILNFNCNAVRQVIDQIQKDEGISIDAIRFIVNAKEAVTLFPDRIKKGNTKKIEMNFTVPFGGDSYGNTYEAKFRVLGVLIYGQTTWEDEIRGSALLYSF